MKILFIGNSHTYMNDMPELVRQAIESASNEPCQAVMLAYSGRTLKWHIDEEYFSARYNILYGGFDYCVMQERAHPMPPYEETSQSVIRLTELCRRSGTVPVLFETWAEKAKPENQAAMNERYRMLSLKCGALLAPVGEVWSAAAKELKDADLYYKDGEHASLFGTYLTATVLTKTLVGKLPDKDFLQTLDFTVPGRFQPVNENKEEETVAVPAEISGVIRRSVDLII
ncbi:MAG: hypothetical protein II135_06130 [Clostridia bacterium]|nr:hypothetical protein [Clostridia bacterium]